ncbi:uncharacterized protein CMC5_075330 [Chondromyces crocatus]|uniref:Uncharacterized protein n=1 Tax=Chondromyces crocatus TaxID=52 RepID=A0A0K1ER28_CHOCO|nr:uncharacterized protein CMC5_075330 [Chondromyces crocatus]
MQAVDREQGLPGQLAVSAILVTAEPTIASAVHDIAPEGRGILLLETVTPIGEFQEPIGEFCGPIGEFRSPIEGDHP